MSFKGRTFKQVWRRLYSTLSRKPSFVKNDLIMGQKRPNGIGSTLWGYFNYPGNVMFVTTNIFSFTALVTYNTMATIRHDQILQQEMLAAQLLTTSSSEQLIPTIDEQFVNNRGTIHNTTTTNNIPQYNSVSVEPKHDNILIQLKNNVLKHLREKVPSPKELILVNESTTTSESPLTIYSPNSMKLEKEIPVKNINSLTANASLFSLFYSYHIYESIIREDWEKFKSGMSNSGNKKNKNGEWRQEVERVSNLSSPILNNLEKKHTSLVTFYRVWNEDDRRQIEQVDKMFKFKFPSWRIYPHSLSEMCKQLHDSNIKTVKDFETLYDSIQNVNMKGLCRLWFFDHSKLLGRTNEYGMNEIFYNKLVEDSFQSKDHLSFKRYSSLVLNPAGNKRNGIFFAVQPQYNSHQIHLDTLLTVLQGYIRLEQRSHKGNTHYDDEVLRIVQLIKNNGYLDKNGTAQILLREDHKSFPPEERNQYFESLSNNKVLTKLLYEVSQRQLPSSH